EIIPRTVLVVQPPACGESDLAECEGLRQDSGGCPRGGDRGACGRTADDEPLGRGRSGGPGYLQKSPSTDYGRHLAPFDDERVLARSLRRRGAAVGVAPEP